MLSRFSHGSTPCQHDDGRTVTWRVGGEETRRHWFTDAVWHDTRGNLNVLNLVEGSEAIVESPMRAFEPFVVHYAATFIVPAAVGLYTIHSHGESVGQRCTTLKAFVR